MFQKWLCGRVSIDDTRLRDEYRNRIGERLASIKEGKEWRMFSMVESE